LLAAALALAGSASYGVAAVTQQRAALRLPATRAFDPAVLLRLCRRPLWLAGLAAAAAGFVLQAAALGLGRLIVVEPVLATGLLFALALAAHRDNRRLTRSEWAAVLAVVGGLGVFLAAGQPTGGQRTSSTLVLGLVAAGAAGLVGLCAVVAGRLAAARRALLLGVGGGVAAGAMDALIKSVTVLAVSRRLEVAADARLYMLFGVGLLTYTVQQNGYRAAGLAAFLPAFAVLEPLTGSVLGLLVYHERLSDGPVQIVLEVAACAAAAWGIARLARLELVSRPVPGGRPPAERAEAKSTPGNSTAGHSKPLDLPRSPGAPGR
jgi:hypothetical protein